MTTERARETRGSSYNIVHIQQVIVRRWINLFIMTFMKF